jgi:hypothetical protein
VIAAGTQQAAFGRAYLAVQHEQAATPSTPQADTAKPPGQ